MKKHLELLKKIKVPELEQEDAFGLSIINGRNALYYAVHMIKGRHPSGESAILKIPECSYLYARDVIQGRWKEAEAVILESPLYSYYYALHVIKGRWPEAEKVIKKDKECWRVYKNTFKVEFEIEEILNS